MVQTGANIQFGGEKEGFISPAYQVEIEEMVKGVASIPTNSHPTTDITSFEKSFMYKIIIPAPHLLNLNLELAEALRQVLQVLQFSQ